MSDVNRTRTEKDRLRNPQYLTITGENGHRFTVFLQPRVSTELNQFHVTFSRFDSNCDDDDDDDDDDGGGGGEQC